MSALGTPLRILCAACAGCCRANHPSDETSRGSRVGRACGGAEAPGIGRSERPLERIAAFLVNLHARNVNADTEPDVVKLPMRRSDIGDMLGLTIETVSRTITKLRTMRVIDVINGTEVHILNTERLKELAGE